MKADPRKIAIEHAARVVALKLYARELTAAEAIASLAAVIDPTRATDTTPRENAAEVRAHQRAEMITEMKRLEQEGRGREAAGIVAAQFAKDRLDPIEVESLTRKLRRWRQKETDTVRLGRAPGGRPLNHDDERKNRNS